MELEEEAQDPPYQQLSLTDLMILWILGRESDFQERAILCLVAIKL